MLWLCISQQTGKFLKWWECQTTLPISWETCTLVKKQQLELNVKQQMGSTLGKEYFKAIYCHPASLTYMQSISWELLSWITQAGIKIVRRNNNLRYADDAALVTESEEELKSFLMKVKEESEKAGLKVNSWKTKIPGPI